MFSLRLPTPALTTARRRAKAGFSLIEVTLSSALLVLLSLFMLDSIMAYRRVSEENKCRLLADAYAWDLLWKQFNRPFDHLPTSTAPEDLLVTLPTAEAKRDLPALSNEGNLPVRRYLYIRREGNKCTLIANVYWKVGGKWRSLWQANNAHFNNPDLLADPDHPDTLDNLLATSPYRLVRTNNSRLTD